MDGKWPDISYGCDRGWNWHVVVYANNEVANIILKSCHQKSATEALVKERNGPTIADATRCDMLEIDGIMHISTSTRNHAANGVRK